MDWHEKDDATLQKKRDLFYERLEVVKEMMKDIEKTLAIIKYKCWYYDTALAIGSEESLKKSVAGGITGGNTGISESLLWLILKLN